MSLERVEAVNPIYGIRIIDKYDPHPCGYSENALIGTLNSISESRHDYDMLMECASFEEVDTFYNPGLEKITDDLILEAIVVDKFSKTEHRLAAVVRVMNKHLGDSEINALEPIVGKPKKTGSYAYVTVQLPFSDGQVVSVIFHAPEGDKRQIGPSDQIIAFRWLLNKRDITQVVAPEDGSEISLESMAKRITQLVVKNSTRFERTQKEAQAERQELEKVREDLKEAQVRQEELIKNMETSSKDNETLGAQLSNTLALLEKQKTINAELQARLEAILKTQPKGDNGKSTTITSDLTEKRAELEAWKRTLESMLKGETSPQNILGYRGSKKEAKKVAETKIKELEEEISRIEDANFGGSPRRRTSENYDGAFGPAYSEFTGKPEQAIEHLLKVKNGYVPGAFYKEGLGPIDLPWSRLEHIINRRNAQGLNGEEFARNLPNLIRAGEIAPDKSDPDTKYITDGEKRAVVALTWNKQTHTWLVSAYPLKNEHRSSDSNTPLNQTNVDGQNPPSNFEAVKNLNTSHPFVNDLNDILAGKYDSDMDKIDELLDQAAAQAEKDSVFEQYEDLFNQAADHLTALLKKKMEGLV